MNVYIDIDGLCENDSLPGGRTFLREVLAALLEKKALSIVLLSYDSMSGMFNVLDQNMVKDGVAADIVPSVNSCAKETIGVDDLCRESLFVDFGAAFGNGWRRSELYPRIKSSGMRIASYVHDMAPCCNSCAFKPVFYVNFLYYVGAFLQYSDFVMAPTRNVIEEIGGLRENLGLGFAPAYAAEPEGIADIIADAAKCPFSTRLVNLFRRRAPKTGPAQIVQDPLFPEYNLGSPIKLFLPCHDGISFSLKDFVWTEGKTAILRVKIRGAFRRGLCLRMDFATLFNSRQRATLFANEKPLGGIEASGKTTRTIPIPADYLGEDRKLAIRMELPDAIAPCELSPTSNDKRLLALQLFDIRLFDEDPYFACRAGEPLFFAEEDGAFAAQYCLKGASTPEKLFTWTDGETVTMRFCPFDFIGSPKSLVLHYKTFLPEERVKVMVAGSVIADYVARGEEKKNMDLPPNCLSPDGYLMVDIFLPDAISPFEMKMGPDFRRLALQLFSVVLE